MVSSASLTPVVITIAGDWNYVHIIIWVCHLLAIMTLYTQIVLQVSALESPLDHSPWRKSRSDMIILKQSYPWVYKESYEPALVSCLNKIQVHLFNFNNVPSWKEHEEPDLSSRTNSAANWATPGKFLMFSATVSKDVVYTSFLPPKRGMILNDIHKFSPVVYSLWILTDQEKSLFGTCVSSTALTLTNFLI